MIKTARNTGVLSDTLKAELDRLVAERRTGIENTVAEVHVYAPGGVTYQAGSTGRAPIAFVTDAAGVGVANVFVSFEAVDAAGTGSGFKVEGVDHPVPTTFAMTEQDGYAYSDDRVWAGPKGGKYQIRVTAPDDAPASVYHDVEITVVENIPGSVKVKPEHGGNLRGGELVQIEPEGTVLDTQGVPMGFGPVFFEPYDPNGTGTVMFYAGSPVSIVESRANESGMASLPFVLMGGSNATGKDFYLRVRRNATVFKDIPFTTT